MRDLRHLLVYTAIVLAIIAVISIGFVLFPDFRFSWQSKAPEEPQVNGSEIMSGVAEFISSAWRPDGTFADYYQCTKNDMVCKPLLNESAYAGGHAIAYLLRYAEATGLTLYRYKADAAMEKALSACEIDVNECERNFFALAAYYDVTKEKRYLEALEKGIQALPQNVTYSTVEEVFPLVVSDHMNKLALLYEYTGKQAYYDAADAVARAVALQGLNEYGGVDLYYANGSAVKVRAPLFAASILTPAYKITKNETYKKAIDSIFLDTDIGSHADAFFSTVTPLQNMRLTVAGLIEMADVETDPAKKRSYDNAADSMMVLIVKNRLDSPLRPIFDGTNNFVTGWINEIKRPEDVSYLEVNLKSTYENALIATLLLEGGYRDHELLLDSFGER